MAVRRRLEVNHVWILEQVTPYEGSETLGVFIDDDVARSTRKDQAWHKVHDRETDQFTHWSTAPEPMGMGSFLILTQYPVRTK